MMKLTHRELEVFALIVQYMLVVDNKNISYSTLRKKVIESTSINRHNLSKYVKIFETKGLLTSQGKHKELIINVALLPVINNNEITIEFKLNLA